METRSAKVTTPWLRPIRGDREGLLQLRQAREAFDRRDWALAFERLQTAGELSVADTMALATAAFLIGDADEAVRTLQAGYQDRIKNGDALGAVRFAFWLGFVLNTRGEMAVGGGWVARAERLLDDQPEDIVERGYLLIHEFFQHLFRGDFARAEETAARVVQTGRRFQDADLVAQGLNCQGWIMIYSGRVPEGLALLDEAMVGVSAGEVSPIIAGSVYCSMIEACQELSDFSRAASWTIALTQWCDAQPSLVPFTGQCSLHRGQIMRLRGAYDEALAEFALAQRRYQAEGTIAPAGRALAEQGDVLRIRGKLDEAEAAYRQAAELGHEPQPGMLLTWLARGGPQRPFRPYAGCWPRREGRCSGHGCFPLPCRRWLRHSFRRRPGNTPTSSPALRRPSATPRSRRRRRTRPQPSSWRPERWRRRSARLVTRVDSGARSDRRTRLRGLGFWSRVRYARSVMRIRHDRSSRLPAAVLPNWAQRRRQMRSTGCSIGRGPAV